MLKDVHNQWDWIAMGVLLHDLVQSCEIYTEVVSPGGVLLLRLDDRRGLGRIMPRCPAWCRQTWQNVLSLFSSLVAPLM